MIGPSASELLPRAELIDPPVEPRDGEEAPDIRRRQAVTGATLVVGTGILAATLAAPAGSGLFFGLGLLAAITWIAGARFSGPVPLRRRPSRMSGVVDVVTPILVGAALFGAFYGAKVLADHIPVLSGSVARILSRADAGPRAMVLLVALINGVGEEMFFRGALYSAFGSHPEVGATLVYCAVTIATLNVALVAAALVVGTVLVVERRSTGGVLAPMLSHLTWSALVILLLPR